MKQTNKPETLADILHVNGDWKNNRDSTIARYQGITKAKVHALTESQGLLWFGRKLSAAVIFVSAIHIWESVAKIAPSTIGMLHLPNWLYWGAALAFTVLIDTIAVYLLKAETALAYTSNHKGKAIWFFYLLTALLNMAFIAANSQEATAVLRISLVEWLGNTFIFLLPIAVPIAMWAIEGQNQRLEASNILLSVDIETLGGLIKANSNTNTTNYNTQLNVNVSAIPPIAITNSANTIDKVIEGNTNPDRVLPLQSNNQMIEDQLETNSIVIEKCNCQRCGALLPQLGNKRSNNMKWVSSKKNGCAVCKPVK